MKIYLLSMMEKNIKAFYSYDDALQAFLEYAVKDGHQEHLEDEFNMQTMDISDPNFRSQLDLILNNMDSLIEEIELSDPTPTQ